MVKNYFNKNLIMSAEENERFKLTYISCKLIKNSDDKVRDHCHISGKYRGAEYWDCNINLTLTKKFLCYFII